MNTLTIVIILALILTVAVLFTGIGSMGHGGKFDEKHGTQLMFARVGLQGVTLLLLLIALYLANV
ncbi:MAG TPA: twin transmembrane helix small protein [Gammaproteobacteria bacterium]|nr:twin transmembrane helix small protein [Gammaproteobacteria bacterium]